jgi:hypothetical protein
MMRSVNYRGIAAALLLLQTIGCAGCADWSQPSIATSKQTGDKIMAALEAYRADNSVFPQRLEDLIPRYLERIDPPLAGDRQWHYWTRPPYTNCEISFEGPSVHDPNYFRGPGGDEWQVDTR